MEWKPYPENKPKDYANCLVLCNKWGGYFLATFHKNYDIFVMSDPNSRHQPCLLVTHFIEIPEQPKLVSK